MNPTDQLIMDLTEQEMRAVVLILASGARGRAVQDATVAEISGALAQTRPRAVKQAADASARRPANCADCL